MDEVEQQAGIGGGWRFSSALPRAKTLIALAFLFLFSAVLWIPQQYPASLAAAGALLLLILLCATALPVVRYLIQDCASQFIFCLPVGFLLHSFGLALAGWIFGVQVWTFISYVLVAFLLFLRFGFPQQKIEMPVGKPWTGSDWILFFIWLACTLALVAVPYSRVGIETSQGYAFRSYYNADFFRNLAVTGMLNSTGVPPENPYMGGTTLHYYWLFHIMVAYWRCAFPSISPVALMILFSLFAVVAFSSCVFVVIRNRISSRATLVFGLLWFLVGASWKGIFALHYLHQRHLPWQSFTILNVEGLLRWLWKAPEVDGLFRTLLYGPQHMFALCGLLLLLIHIKPPDAGVASFFYWMLAFISAGMSAFTGGFVLLSAGLVTLYRFAKQPSVRGLHLFVPPVVLAILFLIIYVLCLKMFFPGGSRIMLGLLPGLKQHYASYLLYNWGMLPMLSIAGLMISWKTSEQRITILLMFCLCFALIYFVALDLPGHSDVALKVGTISHLVILVLAADGIDRVRRWRPAARGATVVLLIALTVPGILTSAMDVYNSSDVRNAKFTTYLTHEDAEVLSWMDRFLPNDAHVLHFSSDIDRFAQDIVPPFGGRPVYLGDRVLSVIFQSSPDEVRRRRKKLTEMYRSGGDELARAMAQDDIDYVFLSANDAFNVPEVTSRFHEPYFTIMKISGKSLLARRNTVQEDS